MKPGKGSLLEKKLIAQKVNPEPGSSKMKSTREGPRG